MDNGLGFFVGGQREGAWRCERIEDEQKAEREARTGWGGLAPLQCVGEPVGPGVRFQDR